MKLMFINFKTKRNKIQQDSRTFSKKNQQSIIIVFYAKLPASLTLDTHQHTQQLAGILSLDHSGIRNESRVSVTEKKLNALCIVFVVV